MILLPPIVFLNIKKCLDQWLSEYDVFTCMEMLKSSFSDIPDETLGSILNQLVTKRVVKNIHSVSKDAIKQDYQDYKTLGGHGIFMSLSKKYKLSPVSVARHLINVLKEEEKKKGIQHDKSETLSLTNTTNQIKDPNLIGEPYLSYEVHLASIYDTSYSQISNVIKAVIGEEYELILQNLLRKKGIHFKTEKDLRKSKLHVFTPDILFEIPVAYNKISIKWIESKAIFADENCHAFYTKKQYCRYVNVYGPGLVIYWFGHTVTTKSTKKIMISHEFPQNLIQLKP